ncbi:NADase-type glycan-binding domain-containing protein [Aestuariimicrobium soli]|uniref:NADase-type glycan-binding domain-containing protein n=1 Tax=Aestuariimicrobium soli TaxID=2035834 RepID=UPI003EBE86D2
MPDDMPDDWFRPRDSDANQAPGQAAPRPQTPGAGQAGAGQTPGGGETPVEQTMERYTTQFKPGYRPRERAGVEPVPPRQQPSPSPAEVNEGPRVPPATHDRGRTAPPTPSSFVGRHRVVVTVVAVLLALVVGLAAGQVLRDRTRGSQVSTPPASTAGSPSGPSATSATPTSSVVPPWSGATKALVPATTAASCTAPNATDIEGKPVTYPATNVTDNEPATAWRCDGDGLGQSLTFTFAPGSVLVGVGVQNGYVKTSGKAQLYDEYRKVTRVRWTLADGSWFTQSLSDNNTSVQQVLIPPTQVTGPVTLTIEASTQPGKTGEATRDAVLLSTVAFVTQG